MTFSDFFIFFIEQLFLIFNQMLTIRAFGRREFQFCRVEAKFYNPYKVLASVGVEPTSAASTPSTATSDALTNPVWS